MGFFISKALCCEPLNVRKLFHSEFFMSGFQKSKFPVLKTDLVFFVWQSAPVLPHLRKRPMRFHRL